jgi:VWFA-related protein
LIAVASRIALSHKNLRWVPLAALAVLSASPFAIPAEKSPQNSSAAVRSILITARTKEGSPADLSVSDLKIKLDGKEATVNAVKRAADIPLYYWLLVDTSGSERSFLKQEREEASTLIAKIVQSGRDYGTLVSFDQQAYLDAEGSDPQVLLKDMGKEIARGSTAFFDALYSSADRPTDVREDVRVMFLFGDGQDNNSHVTRDEAVQALLREKIHVYAFGHADADPEPERSKTKGPDNLKLIAEETGGSAYFPRKASDFEKAAADIAADIQGLYSVSFTSPALKSINPVHKLEIECKKRGVVVSAPREYYLPN